MDADGKSTIDFAEFLSLMARNMKVPTSSTKQKSRNTALWTGTDQNVCSNGCASTAMRISKFGEPEDVNSSEGLMSQARNLQMSEESNIFDNEYIPLIPRQSQRPDQAKLPDGRSNSLSVLTEDHFNIIDVANVLERPRLKGAMSTSIPIDISTTCRTSWCGGVERKTKSRHAAWQFICRGDVTNLQKRAAECNMLACPGLN